MRELRPASTGRSEIHLLYAFDRRRQAVLLLGGDKAGDWDGWYRRNVPLADARFDRHRAMLDSEEARHVADEPGRPRRRRRSKK